MVVNLQGDMPMRRPGDLRAALSPLAEPAVDIATLVAPIRDAAERDNPNVVKAVVGLRRRRSASRRALYFTRSVPSGDGPHYHHIGVYAYRRAALERFIALPPSPLERRESLEQLRALEAGMRIEWRVVDTLPFGVDTPADLDRARAAAAAHRETMTAETGRSPFRASPAPMPIGLPRGHFPTSRPCPAPTFEDAFAAVKSRPCALGMMPIENSVAGRVADMHHLMPRLGPADHRRAVPADPPPSAGAQGRDAEELKTVRSHAHALANAAS